MTPFARSVHCAKSFSIPFVFIWAAVASAAPVKVDFTDARWDMTNAEVVDHLGRRALAGAALLNDVAFADGVIEVDVAVDGRRSYPSIIFRHTGKGNYERFYIRPHRAGLYPDALQYVPVINGVAGWQLYHGDGFTAGANLPRNEWIRLRIEIAGSQARVFINDATAPDLEIMYLKHGTSKGAIGLMGPKDSTAYFSNFRYTITGALEFEEPPAEVTPSGMLTEWEISRSYPAAQVDRTTYPRFFQIFNAQWQKVSAEPSGLVNLSWHLERTGPQAQTAFARTVVHATRPQTVQWSIGYSDDVTVFLNGMPVFSGASGYRSRDPSFLGAVGLFDTVHLPLRKGLNEVFLMVTDSFGGWGFMCRTDRSLDPVTRQHERLTKAWETPPVFKIPESVLYDEIRDVLYVTSFDRVEASHAGRGFISKISTTGEILDLEWVTGLDGPCGMGILGGKLFVVEGFSTNLVEIDIETGKIIARYKAPKSKFLNDVAIGDDGTVYVSNTSRSAPARDVYTFRDGKCDVWKTGMDLHRTNGLFVHDGGLLAGSTGDGLFKRVDLQTGHVTDITSLGAGVIDGIRVDNEGYYLVSHWEGQVYRVSPGGEVVEILNVADAGLNCADFEFIKPSNLLVIPTFLGNRVVAYRLGAI